MNNQSAITSSYKNIVGGGAGTQDHAMKTFDPGMKIMKDKLNQAISANGGKSNSGPVLPQQKQLDKTLQGLDSMFSYQGTKYGDLPSYKAGGGGGQSLDRLAQMMGGQIYNPYQYARMTSSASSSGKLPYESTLSAQSAGQQAALQRQRAREEMELQKLRGSQESGLQSERFKLEGERLRQEQKQSQLFSLQNQLRGMRYGTPEYFDLRMEIDRLRR